MSLHWNEEAKIVMNNLQKRTHQRKSIYNPYKKRFQPIKIKKRVITPTRLPFFPSVDSSWVGDTMNKNPGKGQLRFWVQNCNGLKPNDGSNINHLMTQVHDYGIHYFAFPETNVNASNPNTVSSVHRTFKHRFPSGRMNITNTPGFPKDTSFQPGGIFSAFSSTLNTRYISCTTDPLGRWICHTFRGKTRDICIYTIYRVYRKTDDTTGITSAWTQ